MILIRNFNLLVSTSIYNERNASAELWFTLLMCGDAYPIILNTQYPGLINVLTNLNAKNVISQIKTILEENPRFYNFILKILPIDYTCEADTKIISSVIQQHYQEFINDGDSFKITLKRRQNENIERNNFIEIVSKHIENNVNLENPDKVIRIEVLGNICGISFLNKDEIITKKN